MFSEKERAVLEKIGELLLPTALFSTAKDEFITKLESYLGSQKTSLKKSFRLFLKFLPVFSWFLVRKPLHRLDQEEGERFLEKLAAFPIRRVRQGFWGLRNLLLLVYYTDERCFSEIGYEGPMEDVRQLDASHSL